jgi:hypothetical protein
MSDPEYAKNVFRAAVLEYIEADDKVKSTMAELKVVRKKQSELAATILEFMRKNDIDECTNEHGRLVRRESKRTEPLKPDHIMAELRKELGEGKADDVLQRINNKRETIVKDSLSRRKPLKSDSNNATD